ncbi:MAG: oligosaccharide flippase family protein [Vicinamibacterales bacterium]
MRARLRELSTSVAIYGAGDVAVQVVSLLLLPIFVRYLTRDDYGAIALLVVVESLSKIVSRWGLDGAFMRYYLDQPDAAGRRQLATTLLRFQAVATGTLFAVALAVSGPLARGLFGVEAAPTYVTALRLSLVNIFLVSFTYVPFHVMRMEKRAVAFSALTFTRSSGTLGLRALFVIGLGTGVTGLAAADLLVTLVLLPILWRLARPVLGGAFSMPELRRGLRFGLPRLPHGLAQQALDAGNTYLLSLFLPLAQLGVYNIGATLARGLKLFLSAFETGWAPFYYHTAREPDAKTVFGKVTTYGVAVLALLVAGLASVSNDLVRLMTTPDYAAAGHVIPILAIGVGLQGVYLLTSIGLNLTGNTKYYPTSTGAAALVGLGSGLVLMPRWGATGAAVSFLLAYLTLAATAFYFAQHVYPQRYETGRLARVVLAGVVASLARFPVLTGTAIVDFLARGTLAVALFGIVLVATGFFRASERAVAWEIVTRFSRN